MIVYKILLEKEFLSLKNQKVSYGSVVDKKDGFVHLSTANQLKETLEIHFSSSKSVYILAFESARLVGLVWETSRNNDLFPHLYGKIHFENINKKIFLKKNQDHFLIPIDFLN
ncbi:MAG: DUF952 domain-containing protein [Paracoccaceae bacterium]